MLTVVFRGSALRAPLSGVANHTSATGCSSSNYTEIAGGERNSVDKRIGSRMCNNRIYH